MNFSMTQGDNRTIKSIALAAALGMSLMSGARAQKCADTDHLDDVRRRQYETTQSSVNRETKGDKLH